MNLLVDTHVLLWWLDDPLLLSSEAREVIREGKNAVYVSAAVAWEIAIKKSLDKLDAPDDLEEILAANRFRLLAISFSHALGVSSLPAIHNDPFDRIQASQARLEGFVMVTRDHILKKYPVSVIDA